MHTPLDVDEVTGPAYVSTGHLPPAERVDTFSNHAISDSQSVSQQRAPSRNSCAALATLSCSPVSLMTPVADSRMRGRPQQLVY